MVVTNTPDVLTEATAELTWALILTAARRIGEGERLVRRGAWKGWAIDFMLGTELRGKQLGIIGRGRIGRAVAAKAPAFGMTAKFAKEDMSTDELLVSSDVISINTSLRPGHTAPDRSPRADAHEALGHPDQHGARARSSTRRRWRGRSRSA